MFGRAVRRAACAALLAAVAGPRAVVRAVALAGFDQGVDRPSPLVPLSELGSGLLVTTVYPDRCSARDGIRGGVTSLRFTERVSTGRAFWPWRRRAQSERGRSRVP